MRAFPALAVAHAALLLFLSSCGAKAIAPPSADAASPAKAAPNSSAWGEPEADAPWTVSAEAAAHEETVRTARMLDRVLCPNIQCCVTNLYETGRDRKGQDLLVAEVFGKGDCLAPPPPPPPSPFGSGRLDRTPAPGRKAKARAAVRQAKAEPSADNAESDDGDKEACAAAEYHLVARKGSRARDVALLAKSCNIAPDFPESGDVVEVDPEKKILTHSGGGGNSTWWESSVSVGLDPLRIVATESSTLDRTDTENETAQSWNWDTFSGTSHWSPIDCKKKLALLAEASGRHDAGAATDEDQRDPRFAAQGALLPIVDLPADFVAGGWRTTTLGACSVSLDYSIFSGSGGPSVATARAVMAADTLFVEVSDDRFVGPGKSWVKDDHLELWMGSFDPNDRCDAGRAADVAQWGIRVADGAVFPAYGAPKPLVGVERVVLTRKARFKIPLPRDNGDRITIVYSDSDDGHRQKHLIASSQLRFGEAGSLGETFAVDAKDATCIVKSGALQPKLVPLEVSATSAITERRL